MTILFLCLVVLFGIGPVAAVFSVVAVLGEWAAAIPVVYLVVCRLFD